MTLYEITEDYKRLLAFAESDDIEPEVLADTFEALDGELEVKADGYGRVLAQLKADAENLAGEIERLNKRKKTIEANIDKMVSMLKMAMETTGKTEFKTDLFTFKVVSNGGLQPVKIIGDVPSEFTKTKMVVSNDTEKIRDYLAAYGNTAWAELEPRGRRLSIK